MIEWIKRLFTYTPKFKVGDIILQYGAEKWEIDKTSVILRVGENKYQYRDYDAHVAFTFKINYIDDTHYKVGEIGGK